MHRSLPVRTSRPRLARPAPSVGEDPWTFRRLPGLPGIEVATSRSPMPAHFYTERYGIRYCPGGEPPESGRHCAVRLMQPGEVHIDRSACRCPGLQILFIEPALIHTAARERGLCAAPRSGSGCSAEQDLLEAVRALARALAAGSGAESRTCLGQCIHRLLDVLSAAGTLAREPPDPVRRAREWLRRHCEETVPLAALARISRLSPYHLLRVFRDTLGLPPHAYQIHLRIERARGLLQAGLPPSRVATAVGFADQSHLTRHFRRVLGVTPGTYQAAGRLLAAR